MLYVFFFFYNLRQLSPRRGKYNVITGRLADFFPDVITLNSFPALNSALVFSFQRLLQLFAVNNESRC